jgi:CHAD domain-containing protein
MTEIERKYDVDRQQRVPDLLQIEGIAALDFPGTVTLTAVYFDTDALDLAQHRIILRRREGGADSGWHLKLPASEGRTEMQWPLEADPDGAGPADPADLVDCDDNSGHDSADVPARVLDPIRTIVRDRPLSSLARITTIRTTVLLLNDQGDAIAEFADDDVSASDTRGGVFRKWREWEVELFSAAPATRRERTALLDRIEAGLRGAGAQPSTSIAKIARALGADALTELAPPAARRTKPVEPHAGSAASVVATLRGLQATLTDLDPRVRAEGYQAVHAMRITVRRLRSVLSIYRRLFDRAVVDRLRNDLEVVGLALGAARDADVRVRRVQKDLEGLSAELRDEAADHRLRSESRARAVAAQDQVRRVLTGRQYFGLLDQLDNFLGDPAVTAKTYQSAALEVSKALGRGVTRLQEQTDVALATLKAAAGAAEGESDEADEADAPRGADEAAGVVGAGEPIGPVETALHEVRKAARRLRHAAEAATSGADGGKKYRRLAAAAKEVEKSLGAHRDGLRHREYLTGMAARAHAAGEATFVYGVLATRAAGAEDGAIADLRRAVKQIGALARKL